MARKTVSSASSYIAQPFYKGNAFWGTFGSGMGILAGVVAVTVAIHWLVLVSWALLTGATWCALADAKIKKRSVWTTVVSLILAAALHRFDTKFVPTAPAALHTHLDVITPSPVTGDIYFPFYVGQKPNVAIQYINTGDHAANETYFGLGLSVCRNPLTPEEEAAVWKDSTVHKAVTVGGILTPRSPSHYNTIATTEQLTHEQVIGLDNGFLALCATARVVWKDDTGAYCRYSFQTFHKESTEQPNQVFFNWHNQGVNYNREETCEYGTEPPSVWKKWIPWALLTPDKMSRLSSKLGTPDGEERMIDASEQLLHTPLH